MKQFIIEIEIDLLKTATIRHYVSEFYNKTGLKLSIEFIGSKGYLNSLDIKIEGEDVYTFPLRGQNRLFIFRDAESFIFIESIE